MRRINVVPQDRHFSHKYSIQALPDLSKSGPRRILAALFRADLAHRAFQPPVPLSKANAAPSGVSDLNQATCCTLLLMSYCVRLRGFLFERSTPAVRNGAGGYTNWPVQARAPYMPRRLQATLMLERPNFATFGGGISNGTHETACDATLPCNPNLHAYLFIFEVVQ